MKDPFTVIQTLQVTEKATELAEGFKKYTFKVFPKADKIDVKGAVENIFPDVKVASVNILNQRGKRKRMRSARLGKRPDWKKAIVTLSEGSIEII